MRSRSILPAVAVTLLLTTDLTGVAARERSVDPVGDAIGDSPDIVSVTVSEPQGSPVLTFDIEFASEPALRADEATTDVVFVTLATDAAEPPSVALTMGDEVDYVIGTHTVTLPTFLDEGGHLVVTGDVSDLYWHVVDVASDGPTLSFTLDRKLIGDPATVAWAVLTGVEHGDVDVDVAEEQFDLHPEVGQPFAVYVMRKPFD